MSWRSGYLVQAKIAHQTHRLNLLQDVDKRVCPVDVRDVDDLPLSATRYRAAVVKWMVAWGCPPWFARDSASHDQSSFASMLSVTQAAFFVGAMLGRSST
jgi:hypothetical protein